MTQNPGMIKIHDLATDEVIVREMNEEEIAISEMREQEVADKKKREEETLLAKAAVLEKLGLTEEEAKLLLK